MPRNIRVVRIALTCSAAALWAGAIAFAVLWVAGIVVTWAPRLLSVHLAAASTCTVCAFTCWAVAKNQDPDARLLMRALADLYDRIPDDADLCDRIPGEQPRLRQVR